MSSFREYSRLMLIIITINLVTIMKRIPKISRILISAFLIALAAVPAEAKKKVNEPTAPKYVFFFIGDGMGINQAFGAQLYNRATGNGPYDINFLQFPVRTFVTTVSANSLVTDSSAAGTALASGTKINNNGMGRTADGKDVNSICVDAHVKGFGTGIATSVGVNHATPAAYYAHSESRNDYESIAEQLVKADFIDFAAGGGFNNERRKTGHDSEYLEALFPAAGIPVLKTKAEFKNIADIKSRVLCLDSNPRGEIPLSIDQNPDDICLADFVDAGINYLYAKFGKKGFFFMVEGGLIDHAGHGDDAAADFVEVNDLAKAIDVALSFYDLHPEETLIIVTADHETGALMLGSGKYAMEPGLLANQHESEDSINAKFRQLQSPSWDEVKSFLSDNLGLWTNVPVSEAQEVKFKEMYSAVYGGTDADGGQVVSLYSTSNKIVSEAVDYLDRQAGILMPHGVHTGSPVGVYVKGATAFEFNSAHDNTDLPKLIKKLAKF